MTTDEINEKTYYSDTSSKVTNARVTCNYITVPVDKIESVDVNVRIEEFSFSALVFLSSFAPFLFIGFVPMSFKLPFAFIELILITASLLWLIMVYRNYIELIVTVGGLRLVILSANMKKNDNICKVAAAIGEAIFDEKKYQKLKKVIPLEPPPDFNSSETIRLKLMLDDYEKLKSMKEELVKPKE
jgi:hypothetical protein